MKENLKIDPLLILVDEDDSAIGYMPKLETHIAGKLHRAFSIFIYDSKERKFLLQKRAEHKYHSGGLWSNTCCSHPYKDESWEDALRRCIKNELGISYNFNFELDRNQIIYLGKFKYYKKYTDIAEHEIDHVFIVVPEDDVLLKIEPNPDEISEIQWLSFNEIDKCLRQHRIIPQNQNQIPRH
jgi:isopentenyl-diphosphate delta-isomerase